MDMFDLGAMRKHRERLRRELNTLDVLVAATLSAERTTLRTGPSCSLPNTATDANGLWNPVKLRGARSPSMLVIGSQLSDLAEMPLM